MKKIVATGKTSLSNNIEMHVGPTPPLYPIEGQLWLNTSTVPPSLWRWDGEKWVLQEMDVEKLDPDYVQGVEDAIEDLHQKVLEDIEQIEKDAEALKQTVLDKNKENDAYFEQVNEEIDKVAESLSTTNDNLQTINTNLTDKISAANDDIIANRGEYLGLYGEIDGKHSILAQNVNGIATRVKDAEGNISTLTQTATTIGTQLKDTQGNVNTLALSADALALKIEDANKNIATVTATASAIGTRVSNTEGNISTLTQTATAIGTRLTNAEGNISTVTQTASTLSTKLQTAEGNISTLTQTALGLQTAVTSITNGTASVITQMSDRINLRVAQGDVINQISVEADKGVYIAGKAILLDGNVKVDGTFVAPNIVSKGTDANGRDNYTQITGMKMTSYGYYENTWRGGYRVGYHALTAMSGYIKMQQMTGVNGSSIVSKPALYYTSRGIGTRMDGSGDNDASGVIEFFAQGYSSTASSLALASSGNIILESTYEKGSNIYLNPNGAQVHVCDKWMINYYDVVCGTLSASTLKAGQFYTNTTNLNSSNGAIKIGGVNGNINTIGDVTCYKVVETSRRDLKKNIEVYEDSALDVIDSASIKKYQYKKDVDDVDLPYIGLILDEAPIEVVDTRGEGVLPTSGVWIAWKAIQELNERIKELEGKLVE